MIDNSDIPFRGRNRAQMSNSASQVEPQSRDQFWFFLVMAYLFIEYGRPMDEFGFLKNLRIAMIVDLLLIFSLLGRGNFQFLFDNRQTKIMWFFILLLSSYIPFAVNNRYAYNQTLDVLLYMPFFLSAIVYIRSFDRLKKFFNLWILLMVYLSIKGFLGKGVAGSSFLADENDFSLLVNMMIPFGFFLFMYEKKFIKRMIYLFSALLGVVNVVVSFSRGGFVGLVAVLTFMWLFSPRKILSLFLVAILVLALGSVADQKYWSRIETAMHPEAGTAKERIDSWKAGWSMFLDNPFGVGGNNFQIRFPEYQPKDMPRVMWGRAAHSLYFTLLPELGILGIILYSVLFFYNIRDLFWIKRLKGEFHDDLRYSYYLSLAFFVSFTGYFASGTFISVLYYPHYFYMTAMIVVTRKLAEERLRSIPSGIIDS